MLKTVKLVLINNGENRGTYAPLCFLSSFPTDKDLNETCIRCMNWDFDMPVECSLYKVSDIEIPDWMTEQYYLHNYISYKFSCALAYDFVLTLNEDQYNKFKALGEKYQYFIDEYFKGNTKNPFKISIREQIIAWLNSPYDYKRPTPLSPRQFEAAARYVPLYNAKSISTRAYYSF